PHQPRAPVGHLIITSPGGSGPARRGRTRTALRTRGRAAGPALGGKIADGGGLVTPVALPAAVHPVRPHAEHADRGADGERRGDEQRVYPEEAGWRALRDLPGRPGTGVVPDRDGEPRPDGPGPH